MIYTKHHQIQKKSMFKMTWVYTHNDLNVCALGSLFNLLIVIDDITNATKLRNLASLSKEEIDEYFQELYPKAKRFGSADILRLLRSWSYETTSIKDLGRFDYYTLENYLLKTHVPVFIEMRSMTCMKQHCIFVFRMQIIDGNYDCSMLFCNENLNWCLGENSIFNNITSMFEFSPPKKWNKMVYKKHINEKK